MIKLELDWAANDEPTTGAWSNDGDDVYVRVAFDATPGPSGWPRVTVYADAEPGVEAYRESMALDAWLRDVYGAGEVEDREELLAFVVDA